MKTIIIDGVEYNLTPKVAFREGEWVVSPNGVYWHIDKISNNRYEVTSNTGKSANWPLGTNIYHSFSIQDAKDGDVLANKYGAIFINAGSDESRATLDSYCYLSVQNEFCIEEHKTGSWFYKNNVKPATKEQINLLSQKMKEAGYEWDAEKKELKKIEQKPAWSEEDEKERKRVVGLLEGWLSTFKETCYAEDCKCGIAWLKTLKPQSQWKPSKEQVEALRVYLYHPQYINNSEDERIKLVESLYNNLIKLL